MMVKDSVKFLVDTMLKNDEMNESYEADLDQHKNTHRLTSSIGDSASHNNQSSGEDNRANLCLC